MKTLANILGLIYSSIATYLMYYWFGQYLIDGWFLTLIVILALIFIFIAGYIGCVYIYNNTIEKYKALSLILMIFGVLVGPYVILSGIDWISAENASHYLGYDVHNLSPQQRNTLINQKTVADKLSKRL